jgi:RNA 3'-terminal phosphate cyclase-like protein
MQFQGASHFRHRIALSVLSGKSVLIKDIRKDDEEPGLKSFEASFLRLIEQISDGCRIEINETGTVIKFRPGIIMGGSITHDCGTARAIGWYIEGIIPIAIFAKSPLSLNMTGITNDDTDLSVDILRNVTFPLLKNFNLSGLSLEIKKRGAHPNGGGSVHLFIPITREIQPINITDMGLIKRIRGVGYCSKISPSILARLVDTTRNVLNQYIPDVYIHTDHYKGKDSGLSAGYSLALFAGEGWMEGVYD